MRKLKFRQPYYFESNNKFSHFHYWGWMSKGEFIGPLSMGHNVSGVMGDQFTGLTDKNGVEIYEGDVLRISEDAPEFDAVVSWNDICASFACYLLNDKEKEIYCDHMCGGEMSLVIGNVYENPELLTAL